MIINNSFNLLNNVNNKAKKLAFYSLINALIFSAICNVSVATESANVTTLKLHNAEHTKSLGTVSTLTDKNGVAVLSFAPTNGGVVHEKWDAFSVGKEGLIIENGLGGVGANTIVNEVVGAYTTIGGNVSVVGTKANLYIINPNGILVNNGSFSGNVGKVVLSTGALADSASLAFNKAQNVVIFQNNVSGVSEVYATNITIDNAAVVNMANNAKLKATFDVVNKGKLNATNLTVNANVFSNVGALNAQNVALQLQGDRFFNGLLNKGVLNANTLVVNTVGFVENSGVLTVTNFVANARQDVTNLGILNAKNVTFTANDFIYNEGVMNVENATFNAPILYNIGVLDTVNVTLNVEEVLNKGIENNRLTVTDTNEEDIITQVE